MSEPTHPPIKLPTDKSVCDVTQTFRCNVKSKNFANETCEKSAGFGRHLIFFC